MSLLFVLNLGGNTFVTVSTVPFNRGKNDPKYILHNLQKVEKSAYICFPKNLNIRTQTDC